MGTRARAALALALVAVGALGAPGAHVPAQGNLDCPDFATQADAQSFFWDNGGPIADPHYLDADDDGIACEWNPCPCQYSPPTPPPSDGGPTPTRPARRGLRRLLPAAERMPGGVVVVEEGGRTADEIAATFPDPADAARRLAEWGWAENVYRHFASPDGTLRIEVSLHRFGTGSAAAAALPYYAAGRAA